MRLVALVLMTVMVFSLNAEESEQADDSYLPQRLTASELLEACTASSMTDLGRRKQRFCRGFVSGVEEAIRLYGKQSENAGFCVPAEATSSQLARAYVKYVSRKQPDLKNPASLIVVDALASEFPCQKRQN